MTHADIERLADTEYVTLRIADFKLAHGDRMLIFTDQGEFEAQLSEVVPVVEEPPIEKKKNA